LTLRATHEFARNQPVFKRAYESLDFAALPASQLLSTGMSIAALQRFGTATPAGDGGYWANACRLLKPHVADRSEIEHRWPRLKPRRKLEKPLREFARLRSLHMLDAIEPRSGLRTPPTNNIDPYFDLKSGFMASYSYLVGVLTAGLTRDAEQLTAYLRQGDAVARRTREIGDHDLTNFYFEHLDLPPVDLQWALSSVYRSMANIHIMSIVEGGPNSIDRKRAREAINEAYHILISAPSLWHHGLGHTHSTAAAYLLSLGNRRRAVLTLADAVGAYRQTTDFRRLSICSELLHAVATDKQVSAERILELMFME
jgi:hypothetical protein